MPIQSLRKHQSNNLATAPTLYRIELGDSLSFCFISETQDCAQAKLSCAVLNVASFGSMAFNSSQQARQDFSRKLKWIRPILAAKNDLAINAFGGPHSSSVRHDTQLRVASLCAMTPVMTLRRVGWPCILTTLPLALQLRQNARPLRLRGSRRTPLH